MNLLKIIRSLVAVILTAGPRGSVVATAESALLPQVEIEEIVYEFVPAKTGTTSLGCYGATCIVHHGEDVFVSGLETIPDVPPMNNSRWTLFKRTAVGWQLQQSDPVERQREGCPLGVFSDGRLVLSTNPPLTRDARSGPANPHLLEFAANDRKAPPTRLQPGWTKNPGFTDHSYRSMGVDARSRELVVFNIFHDRANASDYTRDERYWAFLDRRGQWSNHGVVRYPLRAINEELVLADGVCHALALGDVMEPVEAWRRGKPGATSWNYVFRRLFYCSNPNIATSQFGEPLEIDNLDKTAGHMQNLDLWVDRDGAAHLLYLKKSIGYPDMRDRFFPGVPITQSLEHCIVRENKIIGRDTLVLAGEGATAAEPDWARFHATEDGRLFVFYHCVSTDAKGGKLDENRLLEVLPGGKHTASVVVPLKYPFAAWFMTATERGGSPPSHLLEVLGTCVGQPATAIHYARIRL